MITEIEGGVRIRIRLAPRASRTKIMGEHGGALKIALTAPPVEGKANKALIKFLAKKLGVPAGAISIVSGEHARDKVVDVKGCGVDEAGEQLGG